MYGFLTRTSPSGSFSDANSATRGARRRTRRGQLVRYECRFLVQKGLILGRTRMVYGEPFLERFCKHGRGKQERGRLLCAADHMKSRGFM